MIDRRDFTKLAAGAAFLPLMLGGTAQAQGATGVTNVLDYGALGDGVADDTAAIQAALVACRASAQRVLYLPAGTYKVAPTGGDLFALNVQGLTVAGDGIGRTILRDADGIALTNHVRRIAISAPNVTVRDLTIQGSASMSGTYDTGGVDVVTGGLYFRIERVEVVGIYGYGSAGGAGFDCYQDAAVGGGWQWGVMEDCTARDMPGCTGFGVASNGNSFVRCRAIRCGDRSTRHAFYTQGGNNRYEQCYAEQASGFSYHAHKQAQVLDGSGDIYDGCTSINPGLKHMIIDSYGTPPLTRYVTIRACLFKGSAEGLDTRVPALIEGNTFEDVRKQGQRAIVAGLGSQGSIIRGNYLRNSYGIGLYSASTASDNSFETTYGGVCISLAAPGAAANGNRMVAAGVTGLSASGVGVEASNTSYYRNIITVTAPGACIGYNNGVTGTKSGDNELKPLGAWVYSIGGGNFLGPLGTDVVR